MDDEITTIETKTTNEKIVSFFLKNKKKIISILLLLTLIIGSFYSYQIYENRKKEQLAKKYNNSVIEFENGNKSKIILLMKEIVREKNNTYSPLALYFLIDNNLIKNKDEINILFNVLIEETNLKKEIRNLIIYKKGLYN